MKGNALWILFLFWTAVDGSPDETASHPASTAAATERTLIVDVASCGIDLASCQADLQDLRESCDSDDDGGIIGTILSIVGPFLGFFDPVLDFLESIFDFVPFLDTEAGGGDPLGGRRHLIFDFLEDGCQDLLEDCEEDVADFVCDETPTPTASPTVSPSGSPSVSPSVSPTLSPTASPTVSPTAPPTPAPAAPPTPAPAAPPTPAPAAPPTPAPAAPPTPAPAAPPTPSPMMAPCLATEAEIRAALDSAGTDPNLPTDIPVCSGVTTLTAPFDMTGHSFNMFCVAPPCTLSGNNVVQIATGAPVYARFFRLILTEGNVATNGGAILMQGDGQLVIQNSDLVGNFSGDKGGALYIESGTVTIEDTILQMNVARGSMGGNGGAMYIFDGEVSILNVLFEQNEAAANGGALYMLDGTLSVENSDVNENTAGLNAGGFAFDSAPATITTTRFLGNMALIDNDNLNDIGGGAMSAYLSEITLNQVTFLNNQATKGFDIIIEDDITPTIGGTNVICQGEVTFCNGLGGIFETDPDSTVSNTNCASAATGGPTCTP